MKTAVINVKVDDNVKKRAQAVAASVGIPLGTLVNAYLVELANTGQVHFSSVEPLTKKMEEAIEQAEAEIKAGETSEPFETLEEVFEHLDNLQ
jgi:addiction module RelB/DinJ family antitoxin